MSLVVGVFIFIHKHYAWDPEDLSEKLSLEIQICIKCLSYKWNKITVFEINAQNVHYHFFSCCKKYIKQIKYLNHYHY